VFVGLVVLGGVGYLLIFGGWFDEVSPSEPSTQEVAGEQSITKPLTIRLLAAGNFIADTPAQAAAAKDDGSHDYAPLLGELESTFRTADIRFCGAPSTTPLELVTGMAALGCNLVGTASNHTFDKGQSSIDSAVRAWQLNGMLGVAGSNSTMEDQRNVHYFVVHDVKFAFLSYTMSSDVPPSNTFGVNLFDKEWAGKQIIEAKHYGAQVIIVHMNWGSENATGITAEQRATAQFWADQGVSVVLGTGPRVVQAVAELTGTAGNKTAIWYSLGNSIGGQSPSSLAASGLAAIEYDVQSRRIMSMQYLPIYVRAEGGTLRLAPLETGEHDMVEARKVQLTKTLNSAGLQIPLVTTQEY
jgi:poly-gamma-glutamate synthesis protein (capsule biosynthesis protein)